MDSSKKISRWVIGTATVCILIYLGIRNITVVGAGLSWLLNLFYPLILGVVLALIMNVPMRFFEDHMFRKTKKKFLQNLRRPLAFVLSLVLILGIIVGVVWLVIPEFYNAMKIFIKNVIDLIGKISKHKIGDGILSGEFRTLIENVDWKNIVKNLEGFIRNQGANIMDTAVGTISVLVGSVVNFVFAVIFSIYILFSKEKLKSQCSRLIKVWIPEKYGKWIVHSASVASRTFRNFVSGQSLEALILGSLCFVGMLILQIPYAAMISALVVVMALIPVVGAYVAVGIGAFMVYTVSPVKAIIFLVFFLLLQQFEGNVIYPKVMGSKINLPAIWILGAVTVGGALYGPVGMLIAVPLTSTVYVLFKEVTLQREEKLLALKKTEEETKNE